MQGGLKTPVSVNLNLTRLRTTQKLASFINPHQNQQSTKNRPLKFGSTLNYQTRGGSMPIALNIPCRACSEAPKSSRVTNEIKTSVWSFCQKQSQPLPSPEPSQRTMQESWRHEHWPKNPRRSQIDCRRHAPENGIKTAGEGFGGANDLARLAKPCPHKAPNQSTRQVTNQPDYRN